LFFYSFIQNLAITDVPVMKDKS